MGKKFKKQAREGNRMHPLGGFNLIVTDGRTYGRTDIWTDRHMDGQTYRQTYPLTEMQGHIKKTYL